MADEPVEQEETEEALPPGEGATEEALPVGEAAEEPALPAAATTTASTTATSDGNGNGADRSNRRKIREGLVVSDGMTGTVVVAVIERVRHARYGKTVQRTKKLYVDDVENSAKVGDRVRVVETRPLSKLKRWRLTDILERAK
ncbi:MAG: 30S ribosomal protein S17 [Acidimicrobiales bacterium]|nr:30S ribosomal protein S17 [Acidimicrobiales bacterium]